MSVGSLATIQADFDRIARLIAGEPEHPERYESFLLAQVPAASTSVLEIGCGAGRLARMIADRGARVTGIDASPEMIRLARQRSADNARVEFSCGDFAVLPQESKSFDCVVSVTTLHHLPVAAALARMASFVRPGGTLVIHDVRSPAGRGDWLRSALATIVNGDAGWWLGTRLRERRAVREAWRVHGAGETYFTMVDVRAVCEATLPGAKIYRHPLWRYTVVWNRGEAAELGAEGGLSTMIIGAHSIIYSKDPEADRAFLRDVLEFPSVDAGDGWLIFGLPPSEVAVHPSRKNDVHEFYLMCDDVKALCATLRKRKIGCAPVQDQGWGLLTQIALPGGGKLGVYEPRHPRPAAKNARKPKGGVR